MRELIRRIIKEETQKDLSPMITKLLETNFLPSHDEIVCGVKVTAPHNRELASNQEFGFSHYRIDVKVIGGHGTKYFPVTQADRKMYDDIIDEIWQLVYSYIGEPTDIYVKKVKNCDNTLPITTR